MRSNIVHRLLPLLLIAALLLCGCDVFAGKRPPDYPNSRWVCEEPRMELFTDERGNPVCVVGSGEEQRTYEALYTYGDDLILAELGTSSSEFFVFRGDCSFGSEKMTVRVLADKDQLFHGAYERIVFFRQ